MPDGTPADDVGLPARLRDARRAAGLSQADAGGGLLSASYVSLLESGRRRPTPAALAVLADRLGCTVDFLLHGQDPADVDRARLTLDAAEMALRDGDAADALTRLESLSDGLAALGDAGRRRHRRLLAQALESTGRVEDAVRELEALREEAAAAHDYTDHLRLTVDLVRCYQEAGDLAYALDVGQRALETVARYGLRGSDRHAELASAVIGVYTVRGDLVRAEAVVADVLDAVNELGEHSTSRARAALHWNASQLAERRDDLPAALSLAERALAVHAEGDDARAVARLRVAYGCLLLRSAPPRPDQARVELVAGLDGMRDVGSEVDLAHAETELARAELLLERPRDALALLDSAVGRLGSVPRLETAFSVLVRARALLALGQRDDAVAAYRAAAQTLGGLPLSRDAANAWRELADAFTRLGMFEDAALAYQQALTDAGVRAAPDVAVDAAQAVERG